MPVLLTELKFEGLLNTDDLLLAIADVTAAASADSSSVLPLSAIYEQGCVQTHPKTLHRDTVGNLLGP